MKFAALVASAAAIQQKPTHKGLNLSQIMEAMGQPESYELEDVFNWFDRDGSGTIDVYEYVFGMGWWCGYWEYEPTEEDLMYMEEWWYAVDADGNGELSLQEVYDWCYDSGYC